MIRDNIPMEGIQELAHLIAGLLNYSANMHCKSAKYAQSQTGGAPMDYDGTKAQVAAHWAIHYRYIQCVMTEVQRLVN